MHNGCQFATAEFMTLMQSSISTVDYLSSQQLHAEETHTANTQGVAIMSL
jgi:hypothetical protein